MKQFVLYIFLLFFLSLPGVSGQEGRRSVLNDVEQNTVSLTILGNNVRVQNALGAVLEIYNILGMKVSSTRIDSPDKTVALNLSKGWYILKVENVTRKIAIK
jgi:hypothetical protein